MGIPVSKPASLARLFFVFFPVLILVVGASLLASGDGDLLQEARRYLREKSYKKALERYEKALGTEQFAKQRDAIRLEMGRCWTGLRQFPGAMKHVQALIQDRQGTLTAARAQVQLAGILLRKPHHTYVKDGKDVGSRRVPGARYRSTLREDLERAKTELDTAHAAYGRFLQAPAGLSAADVAALPAERAALDYLFVQVLERLQQEIGGWWWRGKASENAERVEAIKPLHERVLNLLKENYLAGVVAGETRDAARALYHRAMYLRRYQEKWWARDPKTRKPLPMPETPGDVLEQLLKEFPKDGFVDDARYALGLLAAQKKHYPEAIAAFEALLATDPGSNWASDARRRIVEIRRPELQLNAGGIRLPGTQPVIKLRTRNVPEVKFTAYRVPLERYLGDADTLKKIEARGFQNLAQSLEEVVGREALRKNREANWQNATPDQGKHLWHDLAASVPVSTTGAYLIVAEGPGVAQAAVLILSDLALVRKQARDHSLFFVADSRTGVPVENVEIMARQKARKRPASVDVGRSNAEGLWSCPHRFPLGMRYNYVDAFAWQDGRYALTGWQYQSWYSSGTTGKIYGFTDRGVYRPGQKVHYAAMLRKGDKAGLYENLPDRRVTVEILDARNKKVHSTSATTDDFGMVQGEWTIPEKSGLGRYRVRINLGGRRGLQTDIYFRVEEYKRPEFEVTVKARGAVRAGEVLPVCVSADYYFGGPVAGARVTYSVFRQAYRHRFHFQDPFSFLYDRAASRSRYGSRYTGSSREELVAHGVGTTDAEGRFEVRVETAPWMKKYPGENHRFRVRAEVMDQSRRTIDGSGSFTIATTAYFAAVRTLRSFAAPGENVTVEVRTENADGRAVAARGVLKILATEPPAPQPKVRRGGGKDEEVEAASPVETLIKTLPVATDENGRAILTWATGEQGYFVLRFEAQDATEARVTADAPFWVCGRDWRGRSYRFQNLEILTDRDTYRVGEVARVLINAQMDNPTLLLTQEADGDILAHEVRRVQGRGTVLEIPVVRPFQPNVFLEALTVHGGTMWAATHEMFVPPVEQFLNVDVSYTSPDYRPGATGEAIIRVTDVDGKPVPGRVAVGTIDASLDYIQGDPAPDIRRFFYGRRRSQGVRDQNSFGFTSNAVAWETVKLPPHHWSGMPPGWNGFPRGTDLWAGDLVVRDKGMFDEERRSLEQNQGGRGGVRRSRSRLAEGAENEELGKSEPAASGAAPAAPAVGGRAEAKSKDGFIGRGGARSVAAPAQLRENFAETAYFNPAVAVGDDGSARVSFAFPDSLTRWRTTARAFTASTRVGQKRVSVITSKNLLVRPQAPRFFRERDEVVLSALVNSSFGEPTEVTVTLALEGDTLKLLDPGERKIVVAPGGEARVDWRVQVEKSGQATMTVSALSAKESDAVKRTFPVLRYGSLRTVTRTATLCEDGPVALKFDLPAARAPGATRLDVVLNPSLAGVLLDAMPYLLDYPYGCVEQTMSRFLPAVVTRATLRRLGVNLEDLKTKRRDLKFAGQLARDRNPVYDSDKLHEMVTQGLKRIAGFQRPDGGFGWFPGGHSDPYMTAYVLYGLKRAMEADVGVDGRMRTRALDYLQAVTAEERSLYRAVYQCYVLALNGRDLPPEVLARAYKARDDLNPYGRALLALAAHHDGRTEWARIALENLEDFVQHDPRTGASWIPASGYRWCWWSDAVETNAFTLMALNEMKPESPLREGLMRWLVANRKGNRWRSTKDTAHAIFALAGFMKSTGELDPDLTVEVLLDGEPLRSLRVTRANLFTFENVIQVPDASLATGEHVVTLRKTGAGRIYATARLTCFNREEVIPAAGHDMALGRTFYRVTPETRQVEGKPVLGWKREKLEAGATVHAGDTIEVVLDVDAFHDYEYAVIEDLKPSGFESVAVRSGPTSRGDLWTFMEVRDSRMVFFVPRLSRGKHELLYRVRAEVPGRLHAMPAVGELMYSPDVGASSVSWKVVVEQ